MTALHDLTVTGIVERIRAREITATEVIEALLARIERLEPKIEAWATLDPDGARAEAAARDKSEGDVALLQGVPLGVKDIIDVAGFPTIAGFEPFRERIAPRDAPVVGRLRAQGAVVLGKAHTTQFALSDPAPTRNPWSAERTPGGSSSGSAAAVAARMVPLALGTQTGGSVLRPAAYCGVVGFKPTYNWVSREGVLPLAWSLDTIGLFTRDVPDAALVFAALTGIPADLAQAAPPRLGLLVEFLDRADADVRAHLEQVAGRLREAGAEVAEARLPIDLDLILAVHHVIMQAETAAVHAAGLLAQPAAYAPRLRADVEVGQLIPAAYLIQAQRLRRRIGRAVDAALAGLDGVLLPTASNTAPSRQTTGDRSFQAVWSLLGTPAITLPTGLNHEGMPLATQIVARRGQDARLLAVAEWCAGRLGLLAPPEILG